MPWWKAALSTAVTHGHPAAFVGTAALATATTLIASAKGGLGREWLNTVADICAADPRHDVYGTTVAKVVHMVPEYTGREPEGPLDEIGRSALATETVPAALLGAAAAPEPFTAAFEDSAT